MTKIGRVDRASIALKNEVRARKDNQEDEKLCPMAEAPSLVPRDILKNTEKSKGMQEEIWRKRDRGR